MKKYTLYSITCTVNNKVYIGVSAWFSSRKCMHLSNLKDGIHRNIYLQEDFNKYGAESFCFDVIQMYDFKSQAYMMENYYTDSVFKLDKRYCYNILSGGDTVQKQITNIHKDRLKNDADYRERISGILSESLMGHKHSEETKDKIRATRIGKKASESTLEKLRINSSGSSNPKAKKVIDSNTGIIYGCLKDAALDIGVNYDCVRARINGKNNKPTSLKWL